jgi:hypothetical protein
MHHPLVEHEQNCSSEPEPGVCGCNSSARVISDLVDNIASRSFGVAFSVLILYMFVSATLLSSFYWLSCFAAKGSVTQDGNLLQPLYITCDVDYRFVDFNYDTTLPVLVRCAPDCALQTKYMRTKQTVNTITYSNSTRLCQAAKDSNVLSYWNTLAVVAPFPAGTGGPPTQGTDISPFFTATQPFSSSLDVNLTPCLLLMNVGVLAGLTIFIAAAVRAYSPTSDVPTEVEGAFGGLYFLSIVFCGYFFVVFCAKPWNRWQYGNQMETATR